MINLITKINKPPINVQESERSLKAIFEQEDEISGLLKDLKTENDEIIEKKMYSNNHVDLDISRIPSKRDNKFDDSGQLILDTELERMLNIKSKENQTGNEKGNDFLNQKILFILKFYKRVQFQITSLILTFL